MGRRHMIASFMLAGFVGIFVLGGLQYYKAAKTKEEVGGYEKLKPDSSNQNPLQYIREDFSVKEDFSTNLPIVILFLDEEVSEYKSFSSGQEQVDENVMPWTGGYMKIIANETGENHLQDIVSCQDNIQIKKRGHSSFAYDKSQYLIKTTESQDILEMGTGKTWVLNGSMADKSMLRNYLAYRLTWEACGGKMAPDSRYCEMLTYKNGKFYYQGVYLFMENISMGENRVEIDEYKEKNAYTSYLVRRDRKTSFDLMLDTYGRLTGKASEWIGVKYPKSSQWSEKVKTYIEQDFSKIEQVLYSKEENVFETYEKYIDKDSFVDYFLINEFFGNYDAGEHSTYMYKPSGGLLSIGPVWDFDQAMNNYYSEEMNTDTLAFQTRTFFQELVQDKKFVNALKKRYHNLRKDVLSWEHILEVIDETTLYLKSAREREWHRWAADYLDGSLKNKHNYYLKDYKKEGVVVSRFNEDYEQELFIIKTYLYKHGKVIQQELTKLYDLAAWDTSLKNQREFLLLIAMTIFVLPSFFIHRRA